MTRLLHLDPFAGAAGDMLFGALLDAGAVRTAVESTLAGLKLPGWRLEIERTSHQGLAGTRVRVVVEQESSPARHLSDVERLLAAAEIPGRVRERAQRVFRALFAAEAEVHGVAIERAHLHELAAVDAVVDIVGVVAAVETLGVDRITCSPVPVGRGVVDTAHGTLPVPPPAVAALLRGVPLARHAADGEMTTPTGAALVVTLAEAWSGVPAGTLRAVGTGLGTRTFQGLPNVARALVLETTATPTCGRPMMVVECTVDDLTGEELAALVARSVEVGARDAWALPGTGRKGRPMHELRVLCDEEKVDPVVATLFGEGATLGVRLVPCTRPELRRVVVPVETPYGRVPVKLAFFAGKLVSAKPEHEPCAALGARAGVPLAVVVDAARLAAPRLGTDESVLIPEP